MVLDLQEISRMKLLNPMHWSKKLQLQSDQMKQIVSLPISKPSITHKACQACVCHLIVQSGFKLAVCAPHPVMLFSLKVSPAH